MLEALLIIVFLVLLFVTSSRLFGNRKYKEARVFEGEKKYKDACYKYAIAILNGSLAERDCRKRIKYLWEQHGPFDYADILEQIKKDGDTPERCGAAGHAATMSIIEEVVKYDNRDASKGETR